MLPQSTSRSILLIQSNFPHPLQIKTVTSQLAVTSPLWPKIHINLSSNNSFQVMRLSLGKLRKEAMTIITLFWDLNQQRPIPIIGISLHSKKEKGANLSINVLWVLIWAIHSLILPLATIKPMMGHRHLRYKK